MRPAAKLFYLTLFSLWNGPAQCQSESSRSHDDACSITPGSIISDACVTYSNLEELNTRVRPAVDDLVRNTDFFSHYRLNLYSKTCPFWDDENGMCGNQACAVDTIDDEKDVPLVWRAEELSKLQGPKAEHPGKRIQAERPQRPLQGSLGESVGESCVVEYDDECDERDYCVPEDESASAKGVYVSLVQNPERFTGYGGESAKMVWDAIYRENCFKKSSFPKSAGLGRSSATLGPAEQDFKAVLQSVGRQQVLAQPGEDVSSSTALDYEGECLEKRVFFRVVSGMHASISTHICWDYLNQSTGEWQRNLQCYVDRLHSHPERISNLYFNYAMVTRAISKIGPHLQGYTFCTGDRDQDTATKAKVTAVVQAALKQPEIFDESLMFKNGEGPSLKQEFKDNFRNISRIMDCTSCDKCRLWGKLQVAGYGAALKVLFEFDNDSGEVPVLSRTELVALFNLYARLSSSVNAITQFRGMLESNTKEHQVDEKVAAIPDRAKKPHAVTSNQDKSETEFETPVDGASESSTEDEWSGHKPSESPRSHRKGQSAAGSSIDEAQLIFSVFKYVMTSFVYLPKFCWHAFLYEADRLYRSYVGLYVPPREPYFIWPNLDEVVNGAAEQPHAPGRDREL